MKRVGLFVPIEIACITMLGTFLSGSIGFAIGGQKGLLVAASIGFVNSLISSVRGIYNWNNWAGFLTFGCDSTWGLVGTALGNVVHLANFSWSKSIYDHEMSYRQNRHVYEGGFCLITSFAFAVGNVISNSGLGGKGVRPSFIKKHEELHIWQSRLFGPLFQATYIVWGIVGFVIGSIVWITDTNETWRGLVVTAAYYNNPFEYWAYKNDSNWPPSRAHRKLLWNAP